MLRNLLLIIVALILTISSASIQYHSGEYGLYGHEGPLEQNWLPREVAGWPAPFLIDSTATSVPHNVGLEDDVRLGSFVASLSFWFLLTLLVARLATRLRHRTPSQ